MDAKDSAARVASTPLDNRTGISVVRYVERMYKHPTPNDTVSRLLDRLEVTNDEWEGIKYATARAMADITDNLSDRPHLVNVINDTWLLGFMVGLRVAELKQ